MSSTQHKTNAPGPGLDRRELLKSVGVLSALGLVSWLRLGGTAGYIRRATADGKRFLRPPGALPEKQFAARCIRCHKCGENCTNSCIKYVGADGPGAVRGTPYIVPREKGCVLCMRCNHGCPSGALRKVDPEHPRIWEAVQMGRAQIDKNICHSHNGFICGACVRACPLQGVALKAGLWEKPVLDPTRCVGCGLCEQACLHLPQAIRVTPGPAPARPPKVGA